MQCQFLVISDFPAWELFVSSSLARGGYPDDEVHFAGSGYQGSVILRHNPPDVIIYYLWTLDMNGYDFCRQVQTIPVLLQGALSPALVYPEARRCGAAGYLRQPVRGEHLVAARDAVLRGETYYPPAPYECMEWETPTDERGCRVLMIDDKPELGDLAQIVLGRGRNDEVRFATGGRRGLAALRQDPPDLIVLGTMMIGLDGLEVYRHIKATPALEQIPVLFQTAWDQDRAYPEMQRLGASGCLTLPYTPQELLAARDAALGGQTYYP